MPTAKRFSCIAFESLKVNNGGLGSKRKDKKNRLHLLQLLMNFCYGGEISKE